MKLLQREPSGETWSPCPGKDEIELANGRVLLIRRERDSVLVSAPGVRTLVGARPAASVQVLGAVAFSVDGEEFRLRHDPLAAPEPFRAGPEPRACARCKLELHEGDLAVRCRCGAFLHEGRRAREGEAVLCLGYLPSCPCGVDLAVLRGDAVEDGDA